MHTDKTKTLIGPLGLLLAVLLTVAVSTAAQTPVPSPSPTEDPNAKYGVISSLEFGARGLRVNGDHEKYRSDLNYKPGFRLFDSSILINDIRGAKYFDQALLQASGWGADPTGMFRLNMTKTGVFKFDSNIRQIKYSNNLKNHAVRYSQPFISGSQHRFQTKRDFGDLDLTIFPESEKFRLRFGYSFNDSKGPGSYNIRYPAFSSPTTTVRGDEFRINSNFNTKSDDFRASVEGELLGFNLGLTYGHRRFRDLTGFSLDSDVGNDPGATNATVTSFIRQYNTKGSTDFLNFFAHRTFAKVFDFTGRVIYSSAVSRIGENDTGVGTSSQSGNTIPRLLIDLDSIAVTGRIKRPQTRADLGFSYRITEKFTVSDTFNFDQFNIGGGNRFFETLVSRTAAGVARPYDISDSLAARSTSYHRYSNMIEADYSASNRFAFHVGYKISHRKVLLEGLDRNLISGAITIGEEEEFENTTHSVIAGTKFKPTKNWVVYADVEKGQSDNVFTRLSNNDIFGFRVRTRASFNNFGLNFTAIARKNDNPGTSVPILGTGGVVLFPATETIATTKTQYYSGSVDWSPRAEFSMSAGYTYSPQTSHVDVIVPVGAPLLTATTWFLGRSDYYSRDSYFYFDFTARPAKRLTMYAAYRIDDDRGQGDRLATRPQDIITSYPMRFQTPEVRLAVRLTKNIDWNLGYQYYGYRESWKMGPFGTTTLGFTPVFPQQNYTAHMPYTSLRIYFGGRAADR